MTFRELPTGLVVEGDSQEKQPVIREIDMHRLARTIGFSLAASIVTILACLWWINTPDGKLFQENLIGETPQAKVKAYVQVVTQGDETTALSLWELPYLTNSEQLDALSGRRKQITSNLLAANLDSRFMILHIEWWGTCCEPGVTGNARDAGGARVRVQLIDKSGLPLIYIFDVFVQDLPYWGAAEGYPLRHWVIRDIYPEGQEPFYWRFVSKRTTEYLE